ncbi:MAG: cation:proton antiporter, partial [Oligoflexus sp.]
MHFPDLIRDLAVILGVAAVVTFLFRRIKQPLVLGYIVAGIIVGPYTPAIFSVKDTESIKIWAELGVVFLMFTLGLEFSFRRLARVGMSAGVTALLQILAMLFWGAVAANILDWPKMDAVFLGCMIAISSTTIIIKALEELGLKTKRFAELVFGILIVEDLAAILMLVALTNIVTTSQLGAVQLLMAAGKLAIVIGVWFLVGMFLVPRFVKSVSKHGTDEMLTVVAAALCLALVALAAYFHYSVALGAFIMGSILAESSEAKRIEHLVNPLKDIFGAVFFVSVGMLLNPKTIIENMDAVLLISTVIVIGKILSVIFGALLTGQTLKTSVQAGLSMAQIGEFSFIIAGLGLSYGAISEQLYPIIVAASVVTTFTTPYLVKVSGPTAAFLENMLPTRLKVTMNNYVTWMQRRSVSSEARSAFFRGLTKWVLNAFLVITIFTIGSERFLPVVATYMGGGYLGPAGAWFVAFLLSAPSIWAMLSSFRYQLEQQKPGVSGPRGLGLLMGRILTIGLVGLLSLRYFPAVITLVGTLSICGLL